MEKIKVFCHHRHKENCAEDLTAEINKWLAEHPNIKILERKMHTQLHASFIVTVTYHYTES